ncbi:type IV fimbrial biogenesis protein PilX [Methylophaga lonarensis MPL]|uniref:Type IV fimbrial biogenesis protein PilX n=1 Tax=Methylophaga lonarensis MPL TaxID=1286106 RepID=M7PKC2_9GAMM|nr:PilX N-terminal domain-containing pilus assembly protein [Methylophaga lonarensis]EMR14305.1 type IV fimbrial biogenesis protein PilX [Methylophaga lonarensis MPL]
MNRFHRIKSIQQTGATLIISLIVLVLMTIIGLAAMRSSMMQERMASNTRDYELASQAAETALREAENWLISQVNEPIPGASRVWLLNDMHPNPNEARNWWEMPARGRAWWLANAVAYSGPALANINSQPRSIIEHQSFITDDLLIGTGSNTTGIDYYRITARGSGGSDQSRVLIQSTVSKRY